MFTPPRVFILGEALSGESNSIHGRRFEFEDGERFSKVRCKINYYTGKHP